MTKRVAELINGHTAGPSHYSAWFEFPCKIRFQYDAQNQNKKPVSKRGVMDLTTGDLWAEDSKSSYRIITLNYKTEAYDIDLYLSGAFYKKVGNFMVFAMNNDKRHDITQDILELKILLPDLAKRCKAQKMSVNP